MTLRRERGFTFVLVVLALASLAVFGMVQLLTSRTSPTARASELDQGFDRARDALVAFVAQEKRLPCPANPNADDGLSVPATATNTCTFANGTLPWRTLGLRREDAYDAWDWKISYRVYSGLQGLTRDQGASMVRCHTDNPAPLPNEIAPTQGLCHSHPAFPPANADQNRTKASSYLAGKGLTLNDHGSARSDVAFVLISHGSTGQGAYSAAGGPAAAPASTDEANNLQAAGPFVAKAGSGPTVSSASPAHFDDILRYMTILDLMTKAGLRERQWTS